jgi:hypothetical protein
MRNRLCRFAAPYVHRALPSPFASHGDHAPRAVSCEECRREKRRRRLQDRSRLSSSSSDSAEDQPRLRLAVEIRPRYAIELCRTLAIRERADLGVPGTSRTLPIAASQGARMIGTRSTRVRRANQWSQTPLAVGTCTLLDVPRNQAVRHPCLRDTDTRRS